MSCTECLRLKIKQFGICGFFVCSRILWSVVCQTAASRYNGLVHAVIYGICDLSDGSVGIFLSKISDRADVGSVFGVFYVAVMLSYIYQTRILRAVSFRYGWYLSVPGDVIPAHIVWGC